MNPFTVHPQQQGISYIEHWHFAMGIACHLLTRVLAFALHAVMPFIPIAPRHDLESTTVYLMERNQWIETTKVSANLTNSQFSVSLNRVRFDDHATPQ